MRYIPTRIHGVIDYLVGALLIALPWLLNIEWTEIQGMIFVIMGVAALVYSLFTKYELGIVRVIGMPFHLLLDALSGFILALSPWLFSFEDEIYLPHVILGVFEIMAAVMTKAKPWPDKK
jgi:hypothetical protein